MGFYQYHNWYRKNIRFLRYSLSGRCEIYLQVTSNRTGRCYLYGKMVYASCWDRNSFHSLLWDSAPASDCFFRIFTIDSLISGFCCRDYGRPSSRQTATSISCFLNSGLKPASRRTVPIFWCGTILLIVHRNHRLPFFYGFIIAQINDKINGNYQQLL